MSTSLLALLGFISWTLLLLALMEVLRSRLVVTGAVPLKIVRDPKLKVGTRVTEEIGTPPRATSAACT